jgi:hypothetical protein
MLAKNHIFRKALQKLLGEKVYEIYRVPYGKTHVLPIHHKSMKTSNQRFELVLTPILYRCIKTIQSTALQRITIRVLLDSYYPERMGQKKTFAGKNTTQRWPNWILIDLNQFWTQVQYLDGKDKK